MNEKNKRGLRALAEKTKPKFDGAAIERLRAGEPLDPESITAVSEGLTHRFRQIARRWGDRRFFTGGFVHLYKDYYGDDGEHDITVDLVFTKTGKKWEFGITNEDSQDYDGSHRTYREIGSASLSDKQRAARYFGRLEKVLIENGEAQRGSLLASFDKISAHAEDAKED